MTHLPQPKIPAITYRPPLKWKNVFNSEHLAGSVGEVILRARVTGYPYFCIDGKVFITPATGSWAESVGSEQEITN